MGEVREEASVVVEDLDVEFGAAGERVDCSGVAVGAHDSHSLGSRFQSRIVSTQHQVRRHRMHHRCGRRGTYCHIGWGVGVGAEKAVVSWERAAEVDGTALVIRAGEAKAKARLAAEEMAVGGRVGAVTVVERVALAGRVAAERVAAERVVVVRAAEEMVVEEMVAGATGVEASVVAATGRAERAEAEMAGAVTAEVGMVVAARAAAARVEAVRVVVGKVVAVREEVVMVVVALKAG